MPSYREFEGKDVENVAKKASKQLNIPFEKLKYDVISYGSTGIFGLVGTKKARIRVAVPEAAKAAAPQNSAEKPLEDSVLKQDRPQSSQQTDETIIDKSNPVQTEDPVEIGNAALQQIIDLITTDAFISVEKNSDRILYNVKGGNSAILIGKRGQTLEAMQYLVEKIVNRRNDNRVRVQVDIGGYLENKNDNLKQLSERLAEKVKRTGKPASVGQMNAHDRRIVHLTLKDDNGIRTQSLGEGLYRKLVIFPKKNASKKKSP